MAASVDGGATASVLLYKSGNKVVRSFQPDFILVRQNVKDGPQEDYKNILLGFQYGNVPSVNSLESIYNFQASHCCVILTQAFFHRFSAGGPSGFAKTLSFLLDFLNFFSKF